MKKIKDDVNNSKTIMILIICIILFFLSVFLMSVDRKYFFMENVLKSINTKINSYIIKNMYITNSVSNNVITSRIKALENENDILKDSLKLSKEKTDCINAEVINHNINKWYSKLEINKGKNSNIKIKYPVINTYGLVGFISKVGNNTSEVNLLTNVNKNNLIAVSIIGDDIITPGTLSGYDKNKNLFIVSNITSSNIINKDDKVILSNSNGIYIGKVIKQKTNDYGLTKTVYVKSSVDFNNLLFLCTEVKL